MTTIRHEDAQLIAISIVGLAIGIAGGAAWAIIVFVATRSSRRQPPTGDGHG